MEIRQIPPTEEDYAKNRVRFEMEVSVDEILEENLRAFQEAAARSHEILRKNRA